MNMTAQSVFVLSLDGVPCWQMQQLLAEGVMPGLGRLFASGGPVRQMRSTLPAVSSTAWSSFATGCNPGKHGIYGFVDRAPAGPGIILPNQNHLRRDDIWQILSRQGRRVFGMNVPSIYPPRPVNGVLVSGFLAPTLLGAVHPPSEARYLAGIDYRIDIDVAKCRREAGHLSEELLFVLERRMEAALHYIKQGPWDLFHLHIMETDRLNHFLISNFLSAGQLACQTRAFFERLDKALMCLLAEVPDLASLIVLSDHGMCPTQYEVQLSQAMAEMGWTRPSPSESGPLAIDRAESKAFGLIPGRLYLNVREREYGGVVGWDEYEALRGKLASDVLAMRDPEGRPVIAQVLRREEVYWPAGRGGVSPAGPACGDAEPYCRAPDLLAVPHEGYDLKMGLGAEEVFRRTDFQGMHTHDDAFLWTRELAADGVTDIHHLGRAILLAAGADVGGLDMD